MFAQKRHRRQLLDGQIQEANNRGINNSSDCTKIVLAKILTPDRGVQSYTEMSGVGAGFYSNQAEATSLFKSIESQTQLIR